ncbi:MAG: hypothetical protein GX306_10940 [Clostridiales bacterium]|nr:hypothetical protein [Clostridiales bacterium]
MKNNRIIQISNNIKSKILLEENIPQLFNYLADRYYTYAGVRLSLHYYTCYGEYVEEGNAWSEEATNILLNINKIIHENIVQQSKIDKNKVIEKVNQLRKEIIKRMSCLTAYSDIFEIYEYVLNRTEYRFREENYPIIEDEEFAKQILRYIFDGEDNVIINTKIKEIIGQLPIRMTKQKYFEEVRKSIHNYLGLEQSQLDTYLYMLRTSAMLYHEEGMDTYYPDLWERKETLAQIKFKEITKEEYQKAKEILEQATRFLRQETSVYYSFQEIINELYALLLTSTYAGMSGTEAGLVQESIDFILRTINTIFLTKDKVEPIEELEEKFQNLEGVQEDISMDIMRTDDVLDEIENNHRSLAQSLMIEPTLNVLLRSRQLLSDSIFIDFDQVSVDKKVDEKTIDYEAEKLQKDMVELFSSQDRMISRAVMANTLSKMPVFFNNHTEVMNYVRYSLDRCTDPYEKAACFEIIQDLMKG